MPTATPKSLYVVLFGALLGFVFASFSTADFAQHLDRQVHSIHCSFLPGITAKDASAASGCQVTMMSPYSSVLRDSLWGGIPIALPAMSVFMLIFLLAAEMRLSRRYGQRNATLLLLLIAVVPAITSMLMAYIALATLGAACKLCIGIYGASGLCLLGAVGCFAGTKSASATMEIIYDEDRDETDPEFRLSAGASAGYVPLVLAGGLFLLAAPVLAYVSASPDHDALIGECGTLPYPGDRYGVMVDVGGNHRGGGEALTAIEILDPLCPACKGFEARLLESGLDRRLQRKLALFPLDNTCNWMVESAIHPGACVISEAILCAEGRAEEVLAWAFAEQEEIRSATKLDPGAAAHMVRLKFPDIGRCIGTSKARSRLNKSLRWAVANRLKILTPQLYIAGHRLCDEDIDLGLNYALTLLLDRHARGELKKVNEDASPPAPLFRAAQPAGEDEAAAVPDVPSTEPKSLSGTTAVGLEGGDSPPTSLDQPPTTATVGKANPAAAPTTAVEAKVEAETEAQSGRPAAIDRALESAKKAADQTPTADPPTTDDPSGAAATGESP